MLAGEGEGRRAGGKDRALAAPGSLRRVRVPLRGDSVRGCRCDEQVQAWRKCGCDWEETGHSTSGIGREMHVLWVEGHWRWRQDSFRETGGEAERERRGSQLRGKAGSPEQGNLLENRGNWTSITLTFLLRWRQVGQVQGVKSPRCHIMEKGLLEAGDVGLHCFMTWGTAP